MPKKRKKDSWRERRRRAAIKYERALRAERARIERKIEEKHMGWPRRKILAALCLLLFSIIAIYGIWYYEPTLSSPSSSPPPSPPPTPPREIAPSFKLTDIDGTEFSLEDFKGKIVILDFFYIRCPPCKAEISHLTQVFERYHQKNVVIISISIDLHYDTVQRLQQFREENGIGWLIARDTMGVADEYNVRAVPTLVIIDQNGNVGFRHVGLTSASTLLSEIESLLKP